MSKHEIDDRPIKPGKLTAEQLKEDENSEGVSALDACCVCGGGKKMNKI